MRGLWRELFTSRVAVNDRDMTKRFAMLPNLRRIISCVHQVVTGRHLVSTQLHQRDRHLAVMKRRRRQDRTDRQTAIIHVQMQLVAVPSLHIALGILLDAFITALWQFCKPFLCSLESLKIEPFQWANLTFGRTPPLLSDLGQFNLFCRFLSTWKSRRIPADVPNQLCSEVLFDQ